MKTIKVDYELSGKIEVQDESLEEYGTDEALDEYLDNDADYAHVKITLSDGRVFEKTKGAK